MLELIPPTHTTLHRPHLLVYPFLPHSHLSNLLVYPFLLHSHLSNLRVLLSTTSNGPSPLCAMKSKLVSCRSQEHSVFGTIIFEYSSNFSIKGFSLSLSHIAAISYWPKFEYWPVFLETRPECWKWTSIGRNFSWGGTWGFPVLVCIVV